MQNNTKNWGVRSTDRVRDRESIELGIGGLIGIGRLIGIGIGGVNRDRGVYRDRVRAGDEHVIPFEKHPPPLPEKKTN